MWILATIIFVSTGEIKTELAKVYDDQSACELAATQSVPKWKYPTFSSKPLINKTGGTYLISGQTKTGTAKLAWCQYAPKG